MELEGSSTRDVVRWHGELLASSWIEQNTGVIPVLRSGAVPGCYRVTAAGRRALKRAQSGAAEDDEAEAA